MTREVVETITSSKKVSFHFEVEVEDPDNIGTWYVLENAVSQRRCFMTQQDAKRAARKYMESESTRTRIVRVWDE